MFNVKKMLVGAAIAVAGFFITPSNAHASTMTLYGDTSTSTNKTGADYKCTFDYNSTTCVLTLKVTNTTDKMEGGNITGFCFDTGHAGDGAVLQSCTNSYFKDLATSSQSNACANPFGNYHDGAGIGGTFGGLGNLNHGTGAGDTDTYVFKITGKDCLTLNTGDFCNSGFACSFANIDQLSCYTSDKVGCKPVAAPLPAAAMGGVMGLVALGAVGLKRRRRAVQA
jgi:hypothetical protein